MPLSVGDRLGPYEILAQVGAGGMGEVYKARDTRLDRHVAIKVSRHEFSERFAREAQAIATLNHPNICTLHDIGSSAEAPGYLVMEFVEGKPLKGPLPLDEALRYAGQIADALDAAHSKKITHRDLKPANILVTKSAGIKLLDFGLARIEAPVKVGDETLTMALTGKGQILGTVFYMSPEQVQGEEAGPASDIFSFGLVLYEMLTGRRVFEGKSAASVIAAILERPAPSVADVAPASLDRILKRCLEKAPDKRWQSARDLGAALECVTTAEPAKAVPLTPEPSKSPATSVLPWAIAIVFAVAALGLGLVAFRHATEEAPRPVKLYLPAPEGASFTAESIPAVSPDSRLIAFTAARDGKSDLYVRELDSLAPRLLPGTVGALYPFWSPDSRFVGFFADGKLKKIDVSGGPPLTLCDASLGPRGGTWNRDDVIVFLPDYTSASQRVLRVSAAGGPTTELPLTGSFRFPWFLPDGKHFIYRFANGSDQGVFVADLNSDRGRLLSPAPSQAVYAAGFLLFLREGTLMAQPFDDSKALITGDPTPVAEHVDYVTLDRRGLFSASQNALAYMAGTSRASSYDSQVTWFDRTGKALGTLGSPGGFRGPVISPDGTFVALDNVDPQGGSRDIWLLNATRGSESRFTFGPQTRQFPVWSPSGNQIAYTSPNGVFQKATGGVGAEKALDNRRNFHPDDWSPDGRYIIEETNDSKTREDIWVLPTFGDKKPVPFLNTEFSERGAKVSPNGQWLAYSSDESKRSEVYVQTFPAHTGKWQVSGGGGDRPVWSRDGRELYFIGADNKLMAVDVKNNGGRFESGVPKPLFDTHMSRVGNNGGMYDVTKDGRFLLPVPIAENSNAPMVVVLNWTATLRK